MDENHQTSPMGTVPIPKLLLKIALPIMISMTIQALYYVIDSIFVARISENALNAVSLSFPVQNGLIAVAVGISVGMNAILSRSLGEKNKEKANLTALHGLLLSGIASVLFMLFAFFGVKPYFSSQTQVVEILTFGEEYLFITTFWGFSILFSITLERTLQATGRTIFTMISQAVGALVNIILDPIFIFGLLGCPRMDVKGAAYATVIGQLVGLGLNVFFNLKYNKELDFSWKSFRFSPSLTGEIANIAVPSMATGAVSSFLVYGLNQIVMVFSVTATGVLGVYYKLQSFIFMPVYGLTNGMIPILAYNFGAKEPRRFMDTLWLGLGTSGAIMIAGTALFQCFPHFLMTLFMVDKDNLDMLEMGIDALEIISFSFPCAGIFVVLSAVFQSLGRGFLSLFSIFLRQIVFQLPCAYLLSSHLGLQGAWYSFLLAETAACLAICFFFHKIYQKDLIHLKKS